MADVEGKVTELCVEDPNLNLFWFKYRDEETGQEVDTRFNIERSVVGSDTYDKMFALLLTALKNKNKIRFNPEGTIRWIIIYLND